MKIKEVLDDHDFREPRVILEHLLAKRQRFLNCNPIAHQAEEVMELRKAGWTLNHIAEKLSTTRYNVTKIVNNSF